MAQSGYTPISLYYSTTAAAAPTSGNLTSGELAINITDGKLYYKDTGGTVRLLASNATSTPVTTISFGSTGLTPATATSGAVTVAGTLAIANGGTGQTTQAAALTALAGTQVAGYYLRSNGTATSLTAIVASDVPTLNQNTTGTAANITATSNSTLTTLSSLSLPGSQVSGNISGNAANVTGTVAIANGGTGATTVAAAQTNLQVDPAGTAIAMAIALG